MKLYISTFVILLCLLFVSCDKNPAEIVSPDTFEALLITTSNAVIVDVRTEEEMKEGYIEGAIPADIREDDFAAKVSSWDPAKTYFIYCRSGKRSRKAYDQMQKAGIEHIYELKGGFNAWKKAGKPVFNDQTPEEENNNN
ncbi:rhodanese-like domain-containing protein [Parabacteroides sp. OttesenSCG-928-K15]|nr:rhodanese-like domain-containing protein [Parabacteroides sp. OttesenSCG-928-K15]